MNKIKEYFSADASYFSFLISNGIVLTLFSLLFPILESVKLIPITIICGICLKPNPLGRLMKSVFMNKPVQGFNYVLYFVISVLGYLVITILPFILELYPQNMDYYYIWVGCASILYFVSLFYLFLHYLSCREK